jgi:hypothetical protein
MNKLIAAIVAVTFSAGSAFAQTATIAPASVPASTSVKQEKATTVPDVKLHATPIVRPVAEPKEVAKEPSKEAVKADVKLELKPDTKDIKKAPEHAHKKIEKSAEKKVEEVKATPAK